MRLAPPSVFASDNLLPSLALEFWVDFERQDVRLHSTSEAKRSGELRIVDRIFFASCQFGQPLELNTPILQQAKPRPNHLSAVLRTPCPKWVVSSLAWPWTWCLRQGLQQMSYPDAVNEKWLKDVATNDQRYGLKMEEQLGDISHP